MRNYTSKKDKVEMYSQKYNLNKEEVKRILTEHEAVLTFEELKIKYDCPTLGQLPDWLTEEKLHIIIQKGINKHYKAVYNSWMTKEEMYSYMQEFLRKQMHRFKNESQLALAIPNRIVWLLKQYLARSSYNAFSLDDTISSNTSPDKESTVEYENYVPSKNTLQKESELIANIKSIKSKSVRTLLIVTGYLVCEIHCLRGLYLEVLRTSETEIHQAIKDLEEIAYNNDDVEIQRDLTNIRPRKRNLKIQDVINKLKLQNSDIGTEYKDSTNSVLQCLQDYINKSMRGEYVG